MNIRLASESDIPHLITICEAAGPAAHWTLQQWTDIFRTQAPPRFAWVALQDSNSQGIGFLVARHNGPEWELENIAVLPDFQRQGTGAGLMSALLSHARAHRAERILLEVRASNLSACRFYDVSGFQVLARRRAYYGNPVEDALIMVRTFEK
jgi:[ribosomal protein S18]-alanine N-acetyltransferase